MFPLRSLQRVFPFCARGIHHISCLILFIGLSASAVPVVAQDPQAADDEVLRVSTDLLLFPARENEAHARVILEGLCRALPIVTTDDDGKQRLCVKGYREHDANIKPRNWSGRE